MAIGRRWNVSGVQSVEQVRGIIALYLIGSRMVTLIKKAIEAQKGYHDIGSVVNSIVYKELREYEKEEWLRLLKKLSNPL